jgi:hypothetical protein
VKYQTRSDLKLALQDYSQALGEAVTWLGERYVLASPQKPHRRHHLPPDFLHANSAQNLVNLRRPFALLPFAGLATPGRRPSRAAQ